VLAIYPEGTTHAESRVQRIKTGAARIALDYEVGSRTGTADPRPPLAVVPVGLSFEIRKAFRGPRCWSPSASRSPSVLT
jgi:1-acyl-sn-glycerol-3-phosphate acyltransferase